MSKLARAGQPSKILAVEIELFEPNLNKSVGCLQMLLTNEGRQPAKPSNLPQETKKELQRDKCKKIYSKQAAEHQMSVAEQTYQVDLSENERKRMRVIRLREQTAIKDFDASVLNSETADEWTKKKALEQI